MISRESFAQLLFLVVLLAFYSEDVMRTVEREVRKSEALIRQKYPGAEYIELEPMSVDVDRLAIDGKFYSYAFEQHR